MNPRTAKEIIIDTVWCFAEPQVDVENRPQVLYKYICFDWLMHTTLHPLLTAVETLPESERDQLLPQGAMLLGKLMEIQPALRGADGKVSEEAQNWRNSSIELVDGIANKLLDQWGLSRYFG